MRHHLSVLTIDGKWLVLLSIDGVNGELFGTFAGFIEMQDLLHGFTDPNVIDIKMGTRTFLESEVTNTTARPDLYQKVI